MSYFEDASLVYIPSAVKNAKTYSIKPTDGSGDLTFSRASNATRVNSSGLVERVRTNEALYSEDQTAWTDQNETSVTANAAANPLNGATTADKVVPSAVSADHYRGKTMANMVGEITASIYVKADGYNFIDFGVFLSGVGYPVRATFDLSTQTISYTSGSIGSISSVGSGWYRISLTCSIASTGLIAIYNRVRPTSSTGDYSGDGTSGMLLWGCQLESGVMTNYVGPTLGTAVSVGPVSGLPRLDYSGGASCPSLLLEPQRSNLVRFSESFDNSVWLKLAAASISPNQSVSPDGYTNADHITWTASGASTQLYQVNSTSGTSKTLSLFIKYISGSGTGFRLSVSSDIQFGINLEFSNGGATLTGTAGVNVTSYKIEDYGNNWFRVSVVAAYSAANTEYNLFRYSGTGTDVYAIWGAQLESDSATYATSYIGPTYSSAVTRVADAASKTGIASLIGQSEGTLYWEGYVTPAGDYNSLMSVEVLSTRFINLRVNPSNQIEFSSASLSADFQIAASTPVSSGTYYKIAGAYKSGQIVLYVNGIQIATSATTFTTPTLTDFRFNVWNVFDHQKSTAQALLFKTRLSNADLATLTTL